MYFNGQDAQLFLNNNYIHDTVTFEFTESQQKMPIYGYKSVVWDDVLLGEIVIQGGFSLNFQNRLTTDPNGITSRYDLIDSIAKFEGSNDTTFTPPVSGEAPIARNKCEIKLIYTSKNWRDNFLGAGQPQYTNTNHLWAQLKEYNASEDMRVLTIENAVITAHTMSMQVDANPVGVFYTFIGRSVKV